MHPLHLRPHTDLHLRPHTGRRPAAFADCLVRDRLKLCGVGQAQVAWARLKFEELTSESALATGGLWRSWTVWCDCVVRLCGPTVNSVV